MANLDKEIADYLEDNAIGTVGTNIFIGKLNDSTDNIVAIIDTGGLQPDAHLPLHNRTIQVFVRNTSQPTSQSKARQIFDLLHNKFWKNVVSGGTNFQLRSSALQEPTPIGQDEKNRYEVSCNYLFLTR